MVIEKIVEKIVEVPRVIDRPVPLRVEKVEIKEVEVVREKLVPVIQIKEIEKVNNVMVPLVK